MGNCFGTDRPAHLKDVDKLEQKFKTGEVLRPCSSHVLKAQRCRYVSALSDAVNQNHLTCVIAFLEAGADVNVSTHSSVPILQHPLDIGPVHNNRTKFMHGHVEIVRRLIQAGADVNKMSTRNFYIGNTALALAAYNGHDECVEMLLEAGADVNTADRQGRTALMSGSARGREDCLKILLKAGADVNVQDIRGKTALHNLADFGHHDCLNLLLEGGADVNICDNQNRSAVAWAAIGKHDKCLEVLIKAGADVTTNTTNANCSPLFLACDSTKCHKTCDWYNPCIKILLRAGAHVNILNEYGNNSFTIYLTTTKHRGSIVRDHVMYLYAAGETVGGDTISEVDSRGRIRVTMETPDYIMQLENASCLKEMCRKVIRDHLVKNNHPRNLFSVVPSVGLPSLLKSYLLFDMKL